MIPFVQWRQQYAVQLVGDERRLFSAKVARCRVEGAVANARPFTKMRVVLPVNSPEFRSYKHENPQTTRQAQL